MAGRLAQLGRRTLDEGRISIGRAAGNLGVTRDDMSLWIREWGLKLVNGDDRPTTTKRVMATSFLAAQVATLESSNGVVATTNVGHLSRYVQLALWRDIPVHS